MIILIVPISGPSLQERVESLEKELECQKNFYSED
jgi:hypothetical protein